VAEHDHALGAEAPGREDRAEADGAVAHDHRRPADADARGEGAVMARQRSLPQMPAWVTRTRASVGSRRAASGTSSIRMSPGPK
jgi:hypothetical protein